MLRVNDVPYEVVIGLEVHAQLRTKTKIFCGCPTEFGAAPNTQTCPVCLGLPGALPVLNKRAVSLAVTAALALGCELRPSSRFARKNYFYPDLPKGYQISQFELPFAEHGFVELPLFEEKDGQRTTKLIGWKSVTLTRIHMEEDAGKNTHLAGGSVVDLNRAGVPLIEIVGEPEIRSPREASDYLRALHHALTSLDVCDGNMEEGSFRCDANVSIRPAGAETFGVRVEIKNVNSFRFVEDAIAYEAARQAACLEAGEVLKPQTRGYDHESKKTYKMRDKEASDDYRYFPDPDLPPFTISEELLDGLRAKLPELLRARVERLSAQYGLGASEAWTIAQSHDLTAYFEAAAKDQKSPKTIANFVVNNLLGLLQGEPLTSSNITPVQVARLVSLIDAGKLNNNLAKQVFLEMFLTGADLADIVKEKGLEVVSDDGAIEAEVVRVIAAHPKQAAEFKAGKESLLGFFVGQVMKAMKGKAQPQAVNDLVKKHLAGA
jgi:aspartyl-tRNA(Asn)/glutamyl-tRNA(Gln) amidotransferase subunit B